jgi:hypothetical protein
MRRVGIFLLNAATKISAGATSGATVPQSSVVGRYASTCRSRPGQRGCRGWFAPINLQYAFREDPMRIGLSAAAALLILVTSGPFALSQVAAGGGAKPEATSGDQHRQRFCSERAARLAGRLAYLEVMLDLTTDQRPLWDKWRDAAMDSAMKVRVACAEAPGPTAVDRAAHLQKVWATMASGMAAAQPALAALYQSLNDDQRRILDRGFMHRHGHHGWHHHGTAGGPSHS